MKLTLHCASLLEATCEMSATELTETLATLATLGCRTVHYLATRAEAQTAKLARESAYLDTSIDYTVRRS